jgi:uncharacterized protein YneF (UPF0154 family)
MTMIVYFALVAILNLILGYAAGVFLTRAKERA